MESKAAQYGPTFVRHQLIHLEHLCSSGPATGWRDSDQERVNVLAKIFFEGLYGLGVFASVAVQIMDKEDPCGHKIIDDGVSTVEALKMCAKQYATNPDCTPNGDAWQETLLSVFRIGLLVRVVRYSDNDDRELREAWNTAKHDEESNTIRWSTLHQKLETVLNRFRKTGCWHAAQKSLVDLLGLSLIHISEPTRPY